MYKYLWKQCLDDYVIINAWKKLRKGKTKKIEVIIIDNDFEYYVGLMKETIRNTRPGNVEHPELAFVPPKHKGRTIYEHGKERKIYCPSIWEQWIHHIVIQVLQPIIMKKMYKYSCGSIPKRGSHYGKRKMERLIRKGFRNYAKLDIRHFFNKIRLDIVITKLKKIIDDSWFLHLIKVIFLHFPKGLPLGFYPSQWLANFILKDMDDAILNEMPIGYVRYMDDMVVCDNNKKKLWKIISIIKQQLGKLRLRIKNNYQVCKFHFVKKNGKQIGRYIDFMGFVFTRVSTILRKKILIRTVRCARRISKCTKISKGQAASMISRAGWFKCSNTRNTWEKFIKPIINIKELKKIVSKWQRRLNRKYEIRLEKREMRNKATTVSANC